MKEQEQWSKWFPTGGLNGKYILKKLCANPSEGFGITLIGIENNAEGLTLQLESLAYSYKITDIAQCAPLLEQLACRHGRAFYTSWSFFEVHNSNYLSWITEQSDGLAKRYGCRHFSIIGENAIIDLLVGSNPRIQIRKVQK